MSDVPEGYKQTEVGVIPEDWVVKQLRDLTAEGLRYGINAPAVKYSDDLPVYIRITDITESGALDSNSRVSVKSDFSLNYLTDLGDILLARTGASVGKSYIHTTDDKLNYVYAGFLIKAKANKSIAEPQFIYASLNTPRYWKWVAVTSQRSGQPGINGQEYGSFLLPLPPLPEQKAIAEALADADALIAAQEQLIAKKQAIKQGAMQELLTGRKRLEGFEGEWEEVRLGDVARVVAGGTPSTNEPSYWDGGIPWCTPSDLTAKSGKYLLSTQRTITQLGMANSAATLLPIGTLLFCSRASVGEMKLATFPVTTNQGFQSIICGPQTSHEFLYYLIQQEIEKFLEVAKGSTFLEVSGQAVKDTRLTFPRLPEQQAIASILSDMDSEIAQLEQELGKLRALKQGMMEELLTGHVRLIGQAKCT